MVRSKIVDADESDEGCLKGERREKKRRLAVTKVLVGRSYVVAATKYVRTGFWLGGPNQGRKRCKAQTKVRDGAGGGGSTGTARYGIPTAS